MSWQVDPAHTQINFSVRHMMISRVRGQFEKFSGSVALDEANPANTRVDFQIETASINTREPQRDGHLRSPDFFNVEAYPYMTFQSKRVEILDDSHARLTGDLTIRNIRREVTLEVEYSGRARSPWGTVSVGFTASAKINRKDWELTWNQALETGGVLVSDEVDISIELELVQVAETQPA